MASRLSGSCPTGILVPAVDRPIYMCTSRENCQCRCCQLALLATGCCLWICVA
jgi:hypothetical protein